MRIVAGRFRGLGLASVGKGDAGAHLRPTSDRVREALFNVLAGGRFGDPFDGTRVLDLFAGTGALGLEALSRGAEFATFVDSGRAARTLISRNIALTKTGDQTQVLGCDTKRLPECEGAGADLIFLDPPYGRNLGGVALARAGETGWIAPGALVVWEEDSPQTPPAGFTELDQRRYGGTHVTLLRAPE